ncbi:hypothetical protein BDA96_03G448100 [Sorghum bicolor]|uniref:Knottins-like domain-containing protein n=2 Tax=Sorghum bicolor TaxID=4558 RepID=A0A1B6Q813_SORBI|nr:hypothetical protein BDA96_03G448100 [Sorghum bicolor]KXG34062.1 hypothetical protein SORBI_3003G415600 [Sorghum bicolor]KXG34063.1 hypothetical protein SORBI_3003G415600 [Sorghum bicolor]
MYMLFSSHQITMASNKIVAVPVVFILALLLVTYCAEAAICSRTNGFYHGRCVSNKDCANSCVQHDLGIGGYCKGWILFIRRCTCTFECPGGKLSSGDEMPLGTRPI